MGVSGDHLTGYYFDPYVQAIFGFQYDTANWNQLEYPGAGATVSTAISGNAILGLHYDDADQQMPNVYVISKSFVYDGSTWTSLVFPGMNNSQAMDLEGNYVVGSYEDEDNQHGFLYSSLSDPAWRTVDYPGANTTAISGISGNMLVGNYKGIDGGGYHGFILHDPTIGGGSVPEPAALLLTLFGLALLPRRRRKQG